MGVRLPPEYQEVEYIQSANGDPQWIDTGIPITYSLVMEITFAVVSVVANYYAMGEHANNNGMFYLYTTTKFQTSYGCPYANTTVNVDTEKHTFRYSFDNSTTIVSENGQQILVRSKISPLATSNSIKIAGTRIRNQLSCKTYSFVAYDNGVKVADFVPCYRKADDKPGMYDLVTETFLVNQGTGKDFTVGPNVIDSISPWLVARRRALMKEPELYPVGTDIRSRYNAVFISGRGIDTNTGEYVEDRYCQASPVYMPISPKYTYWKRGAYPKRAHLSALAFYDKDKNYISYYGKRDYNDFVIPDIPANARYARIAIPNTLDTDVKIIRTA